MCKEGSGGFGTLTLGIYSITMPSKEKSTKQTELKKPKNLIVTTKFIIKRKFLKEMNFHEGSRYKDGYYCSSHN